MNKLLNIALMAIALTPMPAIAAPLNIPICYMITAKGQLIDLTYMCKRTEPNPVQKPKLEVDLCSLAASKWFAAQNQFQRDEAEKDLKVCENSLPKNQL
jgi:hypothetical protein